MTRATSAEFSVIMSTEISGDNDSGVGGVVRKAGPQGESCWVVSPISEGDMSPPDRPI